MEKEKPIGEATAEQIKEWKETHKNVFAIKVDDADGRKHVCYLRAPKRKDLSAASVAGKADPLKFNEVILRQCWLGYGYPHRRQPVPRRFGNDPRYR